MPIDGDLGARLNACGRREPVERMGKDETLQWNKWWVEWPNSSLLAQFTLVGEGIMPVVL